MHNNKCKACGINDRDARSNLCPLCLKEEQNWLGMSAEVKRNSSFNPPKVTISSEEDGVQDVV